MPGWSGFVSDFAIYLRFSRCRGVITFIFQFLRSKMEESNNKKDWFWKIAAFFLNVCLRASRAMRK